MKLYRAPAVAVATSCILGSCAHPDAGVYAGKHERLRISRTGDLEWSPPSKTDDDYQSVGVLAKPDQQGNCHLVMASAHPFLHSSFHFSPDRKTIDVKWRSRIKSLEASRETYYRKQ